MSNLFSLHKCPKCGSIMLTEVTFDNAKGVFKYIYRCINSDCDYREDKKHGY